MPSVLPSRMHHTESTSQADLDLLSLLTADSSSLGPLSPNANASGSGSGSNGGSHDHPHPHPPRKALPRRDAPLDALLISAVLAGSGPVTRHHFTHAVAPPGAYATCDESRPSSPAPDPARHPLPSKVVMHSTQAPRSERLRLQRELANGSSLESEITDKSDHPSTSSNINVPSRQSSINGNDGKLSSSWGTTTTRDGREGRPKRKMSIDPSPVAQILQNASSPSNSNFFHPAPTAPIPQPTLPSISAYQQPLLRSVAVTKNAGRPQVRCMARTRIPTPHGELFLHLYHNSADSKEHLAIVIDPIQLDPSVRARAPRGRREIRSRSLDEQWREGETDMERVVRGAYVGRLLPGGEGNASRPLPPKREIEDALDGLEVVDEEYHDHEQDPDILPLVRIHSECFTGETIGSMRCDCGEQLDEALRQIAQPQPLPSPLHSHDSILDTAAATPFSSRAPSPSTTAASTTQPSVPGRGVVIYMRQEGRGIGLLEKIRAYNLQDLGHDTVTANLMLGHGADERSYSVAAEILRDLGLAGGDQADQPGGIRLLTNNPEKVEGLAKENIKVVERVGMVPRDWNCSANSPKHAHRKLEPEEVDDDEKEYGDWRLRRAGVGLIGAGAARGPELEKYLRTKVERMGHMIDIPDKL